MAASVIKGFSGEHRFLSNFWMAPVDFEGVPYSSAEHAYQAAKTLDPSIRQIIRGLERPGQAKRAGKRLWRPGWARMRLGTMKGIVQAKFCLNPGLAGRLVATHPRKLIEENAWGDTFWGTVQGVGANHLGHLLMEVREELMREQVR